MNASGSKTHLTSLAGIYDPCLYLIDGPSRNEMIRKKIRGAGFAFFSPQEKIKKQRKVYQVPGDGPWNYEDSMKPIENAR